MSNLMYLKKKYKRLSEEFEDSGFSKYQFEKSKIRIPYKSIALALILFIAGLTIFIISLVNIFRTGYDGLNETCFVMFILGSLMIIPGAYHVRIAYGAYKELPGYDYDQIPDFD